MSSIKYMKLALKEAKKAYDIGEVPVGCIIVLNDKVIAKAHNKRESTQDTTAHAEIIAIKKACKKLGSWRLCDCDMYITLEPCSMCSGAIIQSRINNLYFAASDDKMGAAGSVLNLFDYKFNHQVNIHKGILEDDSVLLLKNFFKDLRKLNIEKKNK